MEASLTHEEFSKNANTKFQVQAGRKHSRGIGADRRSRNSKYILSRRNLRS